MKFGDPGTERVSRPEIIESANGIAKREGFITYSIEVSPINCLGIGYLGEYHNMTITGTTADGKKTLHIFVKTIIPCDQIEFIPVENSYYKEIVCYTVIRDTFMELQDEAQIPLEERYKMAKCYDTCNKDTLLLENIAIQGFKNYGDKTKIPLRLLEIAVESLAKFQSLCIAMQQERPKVWEKLRAMKEMEQPYNWNKQWRDYRARCFDNFSEALDSDNAKARFEKFRYKYLDEYKNYFKLGNSSPVVLSHGDYRIGNIMYKEENNTITEICVVDYQLLHFAHPANDLIFFLIGGTDQDTRKNYLNYFKDLFYKTMTKFLSYFNINCATVYPRKVFEKEFKDRADYGLMVAITFFPFYMPAEAVPDLAARECTAMLLPKHDTYKKRVRGLVDDFIQWGYL